MHAPQLNEDAAGRTARVIETRIRGSRPFPQPCIRARRAPSPRPHQENLACVRRRRGGSLCFSQGANGAAGRAGGVGDINQLAFAEAEYGQKFGVAPSTVDPVALVTLDEYNPISVSQNREYAGLIYRHGGSVGVTPGAPGQPCTISGCSSQPFLMKSAVPSGAKILGYWHTHGASSGGFTFDFFSEADVNLANYVGNTYGGLGGYLGTPAGNAYFIGANVLNPASYPANQLYPAIIQTQRFVGGVGVR